MPASAFSECAARKSRFTSSGSGPRDPCSESPRSATPARIASRISSASETNSRSAFERRFARGRRVATLVLPRARSREEVRGDLAQIRGLERLHEVRIRAELEALGAVALGALGRDDDQRNVSIGDVALREGDELETVDVR